MKTSVLIITKNQVDLLKKSLPVLLKQDYKGDCEIIIIDSGSTDGTREYIKSLPLKLVEVAPSRFNYANAFNRGAKVSRGKFLVRLSGDVMPLRKDFLKEILKPLGDPKVGGTYGKYFISGKKGFKYPNFWPEERFPNKLTRYIVKPNLLKMLVSRKHMEKVTNFAGGCCALRRETWETKPFNERMVAAEDAEYAFFLHLIGLDIVCNPNAKVLHEHKTVFLNINFTREFKWRLSLGVEIFKTWTKFKAFNQTPHH